MKYIKIDNIDGYSYSTFMGCKNLNVDNLINRDIYYIGSNVFDGCDNVVRVNLPKTLNFYP